MPKKSKTKRTGSSTKRKSKSTKCSKHVSEHKITDYDEPSMNAIHEITPIPNHLFRVWSNENNVIHKAIKPKINLNIKCMDKSCNAIHYKIVLNKFLIVLCHFDGCNINDNALILLSATLRTVLFDLFMIFKTSSTSSDISPSVLNGGNRSILLLQLFLNNNQIESNGLITLLNAISFPMIYVEYLSLNNNPINNTGAYFISNYIEKCLNLPHRINLSHTKIKNYGINAIIKGMIKRKNTLKTNKDNDEMMAIGLIELREKLKAIGIAIDDIKGDVGVAIDDKDKHNLFVPISIIVDTSIDIENLALNATQNIFICTGADYKYIGHGKCNQNYCAVTATMCTEEHYNGTIQDILTLPLIHLFIDDTPKYEKIKNLDENEAISIEYKEYKNEDDIKDLNNDNGESILWKWEQDEIVNDKDNGHGDNGYLSLVLNEESLEYLLSTSWNMKYLSVNNMDRPPPKLLDLLYEFVYYLKETIPTNMNEWYCLLIKIFETTTLNVDKSKIKCISNALLERTNINKDDDGDDDDDEERLKKYHREIKKYIAQNKQIPFSMEKWKQIIKTMLNCNDVKTINSLSKWAAKLIQSKWNIQQELTDIISSNYIKFILSDKKQQSVMQCILNQCDIKSFGLNKYTMDNQIELQYVVFCIERRIINKYKSENKYNDILNKCIKAEILKIIDSINEINNDDMIILKLKQSKDDSNGKTMDISKLHQLLISVESDLWDRSFFDSV